ncbi:MAG: hypothetical protein JNL75_04020 [Chitinophagales bacterium]|nr:hypothetical protein [Chitinophagales bacterium]
MQQLVNSILTSKAKIISIDGVDAAGKTTFAYQLSNELKKINKKAMVISIDHFHQPKEIRYQKGVDSPHGFYLDSYDYNTFINRCVMPFRYGDKKILTQSFNLQKNIQEEVYCELDNDTIMLVEGIFLHRDELFELWDYSIYLDVKIETSWARNLKRSLESNPNLDIENYKSRFHKRYRAGQEFYFEKCRPKLRASMVINNNNNLLIQNSEFKINI